MIFCRPFVPQFKPNVTSHVLPSAPQAWHMQTSKRWQGLSKSKKSCLICLYLSHVNHMNTGLHSIRSKKNSTTICVPTFRHISFRGDLLCPRYANPLFLFHIGSNFQISLDTLLLLFVTPLEINMDPNHGGL